MKNKENLCGAGARNEGIKAASGDYIAFLDDDVYFERKIEKQLECFLKSDNEKLALVFCDSEMTMDDDVFVCNTYHHYSGNCLYEAMRYICLAPTSQWMAKKEALIFVGMFTIVPCKQDATLILKLLANGYEGDYVPEVLSRYCNYREQERISWGGVKTLMVNLLIEIDAESYMGNYQKIRFRRLNMSSLTGYTIYIKRII